MRPAIDSHDFAHKVRHARSFIEKGDKVKFTIMFRGREIVHNDLGFNIMENIKSDLEDIAIIEKNPSQEGRNITMVMAPSVSPQKSKKK